MKKRLLVVLTAVVMIVAAIPMSASAGTGEKVSIANGTGDVIDAIVNSTGTLPLGGTYSYDANNNVLTLTNAVIEAGKLEQGGVEANGIDITVKIEGTCRIYGTNIDNHGIFVEDGSLIVTGSGSLDIEDVKDGFSCENNVIIDGATINTTDIQESVISADYITFQGVCNAKLTSKNNAAVYATKEIIFNLSGGQVEAKSNGEAAFLANAKDTIKFENGKSNYSITTDKGANGDMVNYNGSGKWISVNADGTPSLYALVKYNATKAGADTSDSSDIALFGVMGLLALYGAGFVYKRREN